MYQCIISTTPGTQYSTLMNCYSPTPKVVLMERNVLPVDGQETRLPLIAGSCTYRNCWADTPWKK